MACIHKERWLEAMLDELTSLSANGVFELCELPPGHDPIAGKWLLKIKRGSQGEIERIKARCVAKRLTQVHGVDIFEGAPVERCTTLSTLYGLKQAAREWHRALENLLSDLGFERCASYLHYT